MDPVAIGRRAGRAVGALAALFVVLHAVPVRAQPVEDPKTKEEAKKLLSGGDAFLKRGDYLTNKGKAEQAKEQYARALAAYQKAYDLVANPQIYFAIAGAEEKLGRYLDAASHYKKVLAEATNIKPELATAATEKLEATKLHLGQLTLTIVPDGTAITVNGNDVGASPLAEPLLLDPGEYTMSFTADGYTPMEQKMTVEAGSESERKFELEHVPVVVEPPRPPPPPPPPPPLPAVSKLPLYVGGGVTGAFVVSAAVNGFLAIGKHGTFTDTGASAQERADARSAGKTFALITDLSIVGAVGAGGFTAWWYFTKYRPKVARRAAMEREQQQAPAFSAIDAGPKWMLAPLVSPGSAGVAVTGWFW
ncbi:MAG: PEGA domain-containing protein [Deltaproteobacteria bacterium]|nr:PEGA domain-containing protein [Deltaproteobacteria bacterium]